MTRLERAQIATKELMQHAYSDQEMPRDVIRRLGKDHSIAREYHKAWHELISKGE